MVTEKVVSSEKLKRLIARFKASQVSKVVKDITVEKSKNVGLRSSPQFSWPPRYASSDDDSVEDSSPMRQRRHRQTKDRRKATD